jgi:Ca-activated chloride channel family protein
MSETTPNANPTRRRGRVLLVCALLVATLTGGLAARRATGPDPLATGGGGPLHLAAPAGHPVRFHAQLDRGSVLQGSDGLVRMELVMAGEERQETSSPRVPTDLVVILDRSGSMQGEALRFAKAAVAELVSRLGDEDRFALVTYANGASMTLPLAEASGAARGRWLAAVEAIRADGGTNMASGIDLANRAIGSARQPGRATRLILLSDGHANQGDHSLEGLRARAARAVAGEWVLSAVGVGQGFDENVMSAIADAGTGNFYYLPHIRELAGVFDDEFAAARETVASALAVGFELEEGVELVEAAGYPLERSGRRVVIRPGSLFAGQERRIWVTLRAPTARPGEVALGRVALEYSGARGRRTELALEGRPTLACVAQEADYYAAFDQESWRRGHRVDRANELKESVARQLKSGEREAAVAEVNAYLDAVRNEQLRALGYVAEEDLAEVKALRDRVAAPAAAEPEEQRRLGKSLLQEGRDARRAGSKRSQ